jgi:hypothetical protein
VTRGGAGAAPGRRERVLFAVAVCVNLAVLYWPRSVDPSGGPLPLDKVAHVLVFGAVAWAGLRAGWRARLLLPLLALHAVASEVVQARLLSARSGDPADVVADLAGVLAGTLLAQASWLHERAALGTPGDRARRPAAGGDTGVGRRHVRAQRRPRPRP